MAKQDCYVCKEVKGDMSHTITLFKKMQSEDFINAYLNKGRMRALAEQIAVYLVTNERIGVLGAMSEAVKTQQVSK